MGMHVNVRRFSNRKELATIFFYHEDGSSIFLRNVATYLQNHAAATHPRRHLNDNLKSLKNIRP